MKRVWGTELQRRIVMRVPTYNKRTINSVKISPRSQIAHLSLPQSLRTWLGRIVSVIPLQATKLRDAVRGGAPLRTVNTVVRELQAGVQNGTVQAVPLQVGSQRRAWQFSDCAQVQHAVVQRVSRQLVQRGERRCRCKRLMQQHPELQNDLQHVILRTHRQWECLMGAAGADTLSGNSRQCVVPSMTVLEERMDIF